MATPFEAFVNAELPKRVYTQDSPLSWPAGKVVVSTGTGLSVSIQDFPQVPVTSVNSQIGDVIVSPLSIGAIPASEKGATNGVATLVGGVIPTSQIPALAIVEYLGAVASEAAMLALTGQRGDWCKRTDQSMVYILIADDPSQLANWTSIAYPPSPILSVNGQTGVVVLGASDVGADVSGAAAAAISTHVLDNDPHPQYTTAAEAASAAPVQSVNGHTGAVSLTYSDVNADQSGAAATAQAYAIQRANHTGTQLANTISDFNTAASSAAPVQSVNGHTGAVSLTYSDVGAQPSLGFTPENVANKDTDGALTANSDTKYPSQKAVKTYSDSAKSTVWRLVDGADVTKKIAFSAASIATATTRTITMPDANVNLGYVPSSFAVSGGVATMTGAGGNTLSFGLNQPNSVALTANTTAVVGTRYKIPSGASNYTLNLPASPADGDTIWIEDCLLEEGNTRFNAWGTVTVNAGANWVFINGYYHSVNIVDPANFIVLYPDFVLRLRYNASSSTWGAYCTCRNQSGSERANNLFLYKIGAAYGVQLDCSAVTAQRSLTMADGNVNLSYVPGSFTVSGGTATMTGAGGATLSFPVYDPLPITTSAGLNLLAKRVYQCSADASTYTIYLPVAPADGDWVVIKDTPPNKTSRIGSAGVITVNGGTHNVLSALTTTWDMTGPASFGAARFTYLLVWSTANAYWMVLNLTPDPSYLQGGIKLCSSNFLGYGKVTQLISQANTSNRSVQFPDYDIDFTWYNSLPYRNSLFGTIPSGVNSVILAGTGHKATKNYQAVLCGISANADGLCPDDSAIFANRSTVYTSSRVTGYIATLKGQSTGTASAMLATSSNVQGPAYLTKPTGHHAVSVFNLTLSHTTSAGNVWTGVRRVSVRWDGTTATLDTQTIGTDWNPDSQTISFTPGVSSGNIGFNLANTTAGGGDTCYWQCTYEAHHNGG